RARGARTCAEPWKRSVRARQVGKVRWYRYQPCIKAAEKRRDEFESRRVQQQDPVAGPAARLQPGGNRLTAQIERLVGDEVAFILAVAQERVRHIQGLQRRSQAQ